MPDPLLEFEHLVAYAGLTVELEVAAGILWNRALAEGSGAQLGRKASTQHPGITLKLLQHCPTRKRAPASAFS